MPAAAGLPGGKSGEEPEKIPSIQPFPFDAAAAFFYTEITDKRQRNAKIGLTEGIEYEKFFHPLRHRAPAALL
jgi:hypothetical protein